VRIAHVLFIITALLGTGAQFAQSAQSATSADAFAEKRPAISLKLNAVQDVVKAGAPVLVKVATTNVSDHKITVVFRTMGCALISFGFDVRDENGDPALDGPFERRLKAERDPTATNVKPMTGNAAFVELAPGETFDRETGVDCRHDLTRPGKYRIRVVKIDDETKTVVKSNMITVTVTP